MKRFIEVLLDRSFASLTLAQFLAALNDNALKQIFLLLVVAEALDSGGVVGYESQAAATALFAMPFLLFSVWAGQMADRYSKRTVIVVCKAFEIAVMLLAGWGIWIDSLPLILVSLLLMATQSSFFSPSKYGILPELLPVNRLSAGNGIIQMTTYVAIMFGTAMAGILLQWYADRRWIIASILLVLAVVGWLVTYLIEPLAPADPDRSFDWNPFRHFSDNMRWIGTDRFLFVCVLGFALAWFAGTILTLNLNVYGMDTLALGYRDTSLLVVVTGMGMAIGCLLAGWWSGEGVEVGLALPGAAGMGICLVLLTNPVDATSAGILLFVGGVFGGLYLLPLLTALQEHPDPELKGEVLATANIFTFAGMILSSGSYYLLVGTYGWSARGIMAGLGWGLILLSVLLPFAHPKFFRRAVRCLLVAVGRIIYRMRFRGEIDRLQAENGSGEGALILSNHVSYLDWWFIGMAFHRLPRYVIHGHYHDVPILGWCLRFMKTIPIDPRRPRQTGAALEEMERQLKNGEVVVIFPEGEISRNGQLLGIRPGIRRFIENSDIRVVPVYLDNLWGRWWTYAKGSILWKWPRKLLQPVFVWFGEPIEPPRSREEVYRNLQVLQGRARRSRLESGPAPLVRFVRTFRRRFYEPVGRDGFTGERPRRGSVLISTVALAQKLSDRLAGDGRRAGVMLPPSVPAMTVNLALNLTGRSAVNLNPRMPEREFKSCLDRAQIDRIVTVPEVLDRLDFDLERDVIDLTDIRREVGWLDRVRAAGLCLLPTGLLLRRFGGLSDPTQEHTVVFTSGTTGEPKGVRVSGLNLLSNLSGLQRVFDLGPGVRAVLLLPFYHSFGYVAGVWGPALGYCRALYHHDPTDTASIRELIERNGAEVMVGVPDLYDLLLKREGPDLFESMDRLLTGSEPLPDPLADRFEDRVGTPLLNGYGLTEMTPGVAVNVPDIEMWEGVQEGIRRGSVGRALPGVALRIVDRETGEPLPFDQPGEIETRGPNRMIGYLDESPPGKWWSTGDRGRLDEDGFLHVVGRYRRFTKRGGEMISHQTVEERAEALLSGDDGDPPETAVTGVTGPEGEELVLITESDRSPREVHRLLREESDLPNAWIPRQDRIFSGRSVPRQSMGGLDLDDLNDLASDLVEKTAGEDR